MMQNFINPFIDPLKTNSATGITSRTARESFRDRRRIDKTRSTIGSYQTAAKRTLLSNYQSNRYDSESDYGTSQNKENTELDNNSGLRGNRQSTGSNDIGNSRQSSNAKAGGLSIPCRSSNPVFREPPTRSYNPYQ